MKCGVVIGHYNSSLILELNIRTIQKNCGTIPILISDDCSDGLGPNPAPFSEYAALYAIAEKYVNVCLWPNTQRIGHAGGDMAAFWKGIVWGKNLGLDYIAKISQRFIIDIPNWLESSAIKLSSVGYPVAGNGSPRYGFGVRTESVLLNVSMWHKPEILELLAPRTLGRAFEPYFANIVTQQFSGKMLPWDIMAKDRMIPAEGILFRESNKQEDYVKLAEKYGLYVAPDCRSSVLMKGYKKG